MVFTQELYIPFHYIDTAGILFFGKSTEIYHQLYEAWLLRSGKSWNSIFASNDIGIPIKHFSVEFNKPVLGGQTYLGTLSITRIGKTSFETSFKLEKEGNVYFQTKTTHVFMSKKTLSPQSIPAEWRDYLFQYHAQ
ncbi:MAG: hypothetical protein KDD37_08975 [Bdellovibrionales bacterium]|nr:hypothetical protein [Bdellovibrionales bacterium]